MVACSAARPPRDEPPPTEPRGGSPLHIYVDADACPVKPEVYRVARRYDLAVTIVAGNWMRIPHGPRVALEIVEQGFDAADDWIVAHVAPNDLVITGDVPLAARCIEKGARALGPTGRAYTVENIGDALATRNLMSDLRSAGRELVRPAPFDPRDRSRFLEALDREIQSLSSMRTSGDGLGRVREV